MGGCTIRGKTNNALLAAVVKPPSVMGEPSMAH